MIPAQGSPKTNSQTSFMQRGTTPLNIWYCGAQNQTAYSTAAQSANFLTAHVFTLSRPVVVSKISFELVTGVPGGQARCGIYRATSLANIYPNELLLDGGDYTCTAGLEGVKTTSGLSVNLSAGTYWFAFTSTGGPTMRRLAVGAVPHIVGAPSTIATLYDTLRAARAYGALPSTYPAAQTLVTAVGDSPVIALEFS